VRELVFCRRKPLKYNRRHSVLAHMQASTSRPWVAWLAPGHGVDGVPALRGARDECLQGFRGAGSRKETKPVDPEALRVPSAGLRRTPPDSNHQLQRRPAEATGGAGDSCTDTAHHERCCLLLSFTTASLGRLEGAGERRIRWVVS
jgi:hypothetical protein